MRIHLLRHAEAEPESESGRDADRRLSRAGADRMVLVSRGIATLDLRLDAILISPLIRARETAEPVARACGFKAVLTPTPNLVPEAPPEEILLEIARMRFRSVLLVGHQPHLGRLLGRLVTGDFKLDLPMKKAALAACEMEGDPSRDRADLLFLLPARVLEKLG